MVYADRRDAGRRLAVAVAAALESFDPGTVLVLGVPRGGVTVAAEVAAALGAPLDVALARKLGAPGNRELAIGAIAEHGAPVVDASLVRRLGVTSEYLEGEIDRQRTELARRAARYRGDRPAPSIAGRVVVVVDDGIATGSTLEAVLVATAAGGPARLVGAVPVGPPGSIARLASRVDTMVCPLQPRHFMAVGEWYADFAQVTDDEVVEILRARP
jgi:putative phosphoribosyl transferase